MVTAGAMPGMRGWSVLCEDYPKECVQKSTGRSVKLTSDRFRLMEAVNTRVNTSIWPVEDKEHWKGDTRYMQPNGAVDRWDFAEDGSGDCEDFALVKRRELMTKGFPQSALLITVVIDETGDGHAVLTVVADRGDYVLDNKTARILPWRETPYTYVKRQSQADQNRWIGIDPKPRSDPIGPTASPAR